MSGLAGEVGPRPVRPEDTFDATAVHRWLAPRVPQLAGYDPPRVAQFAGGSSNLTYLLDYGDLELVLRRPPHGHRARGAHEMAREARIQQRLHPRLDVVPTIHAVCEDLSVIGAEFYVMQRLHGLIIASPTQPGLDLPPPRAHALGLLVHDTLADLHTIDVDDAGLADLGRGPGYVHRQVDGWSARLRAARTDDVPDGEAVMAWLDARRRDDVATRMLHGDWKLDNLLLDLSGGVPRVTGVLDWEMAAVGDPLMDLGASLAYWVTEHDDARLRALLNQPSVLPGMPGRDEIVARYLERTGLRTDDWSFYEVFGIFRLAVIVAQIWARYRAGHSTNPRFAGYGEITTALLERAAEVAGCR